MKNWLSLTLSFLAYSLFLINPNLSGEQTPVHKYFQPLKTTQAHSFLNIDCVYAINSAEESNQELSNEPLFSLAQLKVLPVQEISSSYISEDEKRELAGVYNPSLCNKEVGDLLTHLSVLHDADLKGYNTIWLMTQDIEFVDDIRKISQLVDDLSRLDPEWDILYTDKDKQNEDGTYTSSTKYNPRPNQTVPFDVYSQPKTPISASLLRIQHRVGAYSMILSKRGIKKILNYFNTNYVWTTFDEDIHYIPSIRQYCCADDIVTNKTDYSLEHSYYKPKDKIALIANWNLATLPANFHTLQEHYRLKITCPKNSSPTFQLPNDLKSYQKILLFNPYFNFKNFKDIPKDKLVLFLWEPEKVPTSIYDLVEQVYTWDDTLIDNKKFFKFYYPELKPMLQILPSFEQKKLSTMISSRWLPHRKVILEFFQEKPKGEFEFYSRTCPDLKYISMYKGPIAGHHSGTEKISLLKDYRFCFCFEHTLGLEGYITEKIFDCFAAGSVPIYYGAKNIDQYIPKDCFIDMQAFATLEDLYTFIKNMPKETYERYIDNIKKYLNSEQAYLFSKENFEKIIFEASLSKTPC